MGLTYKAFTGLALVHPSLAAVEGDVGLGLVWAGGTGITVGAARQVHLRIGTVTHKPVASHRTFRTGALGTLRARRSPGVPMWPLLAIHDTAW